METYRENTTDGTSRPVTILTGYLGAGKTTFLNSLMAANPNAAK
ncbi:hypothetical protein JHJ32_19205 [Parapedobacter sp. ISTM3]|nr:GTP-binding protein [Parapedobacter sp. ISTM3]MBK1442133.1 hypothetical protein [Parapedobacter sp. ISTM3]